MYIYFLLSLVVSMSFWYANGQLSRQLCCMLVWQEIVHYKGLKLKYHRFLVIVSRELEIQTSSRII